MSYKIEKINNELLSIKFHGIVPFKDRIKARTEVASFCKNRGFSHVLIEMLDSKMDMNMGDIIKFVESFTDFLLPESVKISGVINQGDKVNQIIEMMLVSKGYRIKFFAQRKEAINWLIEA